jgi:hypothetical protein
MILPTHVMPVAITMIVVASAWGRYLRATRPRPERTPEAGPRAKAAAEPKAPAIPRQYGERTCPTSTRR